MPKSIMGRSGGSQVYHFMILMLCAPHLAWADCSAEDLTRLGVTQQGVSEAENI